jgi:putative ABC transport system permease protein
MILTRWVTLRSLRTRPLRTLLSAFGIVLGVAGLLAIQITNQTALVSLSALFAGTSGKTDLIVTAAQADEQGIPERILNRLASSPEVANAVPSLQQPVSLAVEMSETAMPLSMMGFETGGFMVYGIDPTLDPAVRDYTLTQGTFLSASRDVQEIVLVENYADDNDLQVGNTVELVTPQGSQEFEVIGLIAKEGAGQNNNGAFGVIPLRTAQQIFNRSGALDQIDLVLQPEYKSASKLETAKENIQRQLGADYAVTSSASQGDRVTQMLNGFSIGLNFMSGMALFVGGYLIYNAFSMTIVERTREFGLLRTLGLTRRQITGQVLVEAALLGLGGSIVGALVGVGLAVGASRLLALLLNLDSVPVKIAPPTILTSFLVGILVTVIAALIPAWQAGRISPLEALRVRGVQREGWLLRRGLWVGLVLLLISTIILIANPFPYDVQFRLGSLTVVLLFFGGTLLIPGSVGLWERLTRPFIRRLYGTAGQLGSANLQRSRLRTTLTVAALMVGVSMIIITRGMTDSFRGDLEVWIDAYIGGDLMVSSTTPMRSQVMRRLQNVPGVQAVTPMRTLSASWLKPDGEEQELVFMAVDPDTYSQVTTFVFSDSQTDVQAAYRQLAEGKAVFISSVLAEKYGLQPGNLLRLRTRSGLQDFTIAAIVVNFFNQGLTVQGSWQDMRRYFKTDDANAYLVKVAADASIPEVKQQIEDTYARRENLTVISNQALINQVFNLLNQAYSMFDAMAVIAMLVGALGVVNTLTMNVVERTQEIGMLRSIGLTRRQTLVMVLAEALLMGLIGGLFGLAFGAVLTRIFLWSMTAMSGYKITFVLPLTAILIGLVISLVVSQLAALFPARRAARTQILQAIHYE